MKKKKRGLLGRASKLKEKIENKAPAAWYVYVLETKNKALYTGITNNLDRRMKLHRSGRGARFTRIFGFKSLLYWEIQVSRIQAMRREVEIKRWPRQKKIKLIENFQDVS